MMTGSTTQQQANGSFGDEVSESKRKALQKKLNCGSCEGLVRNAVLESRCTEIGKLPVSKACPSHRPDVFTLATGEEKTNLLESVAEVMSRLNPNDLQILASLMLNEKTTRRYGYKFHQKVYIRVRGQTTANYMSNFAVGYVLSADKEHVRVIGESGSMAVTFLNDRDSLTLYTVKRFNELRETMIADKMFNDPNLETRIIPKSADKSEDTIKTFDQAVSEGLVEKKKRSERGDLVALVSRLTKGHLRAEKPERRAGEDRRSSGSSVKFKY